jgi:hypothetical protein
MNKVLLRLLLSVVLERSWRFRLLLGDALGIETDTFDEWDTSLAPPAPTQFVNAAVSPRAAAAALAACREVLLPAWEARHWAEALFNEKPMGDADARERMVTHILGPYQRLCAASTWLHAWLPGPLPEETRYWWQDTLVEASPPWMLLGPEGSSGILNLPLEENVAAGPLMPISVLQRQTPLAWAGLGPYMTSGDVAAALKTLAMAKNQAATSKPAQVLKQCNPTLLPHFMNLRVVGPAYYLTTVLDALLQQHTTFLTEAEPMLFAALNHNNVADKSVVILHEVVQNAHYVLPAFAAQQWDTPTATASNEEAAPGHGTAPDAAWINDVLAAVETLIPARQAYTDKQLQRALQLQDRFSSDTLASALHVYPLTDVLPEVLETNGSRAGRIYDVLDRVAEAPCTPREIIHAGWLHRLEQTPNWLWRWVQQGQGAQASGGRGRKPSGVQHPPAEDEFTQLDALLLRSIEVSEVHRSLVASL